MGKPLLIGADFVTTLDDVHALIAEHTIGLFSGFVIEVQNGLVIFLWSIAVMQSLNAVVAIIAFVILMILVSGAARRMHVGRVKYDRVYTAVLVRQFGRVRAVH